VTSLEPQPASDQRPAYRRPAFWLKAAVSVLLLAYVFSKVGWKPVWDELSRVHTGYLALYILLGLVGTLVSSLKWHVLCQPLGLRTSHGRLFALYLIGYFFNHILPTSVGGDVVRAYQLGRAENRLAAATATVFMERFTGLVVLNVLALLAVLIDPRFRGNLWFVGLVSAVVAGTVLLAWLVFSRTLLNRLQALPLPEPVPRILTKIGKVQTAVLSYRGHPRALAVSMVYSVLFYAVSVLIVYVGCLSLGHRPPMIGMLVAVPVMLVVFMVPISLGGVGLQEWAYFAVLGVIGVPQAVGLSLGLLYRARSLLFGLAGGVLFPFTASAGSAAAPTTDAAVLEKVTP